MEYRTSQNRARRDIPTRPEARHDTVTRDVAMSKYLVPRNFTVRFMFCQNVAFLVSRASYRACASQMPDYDKGTSAGAIWACRLMADRLLTLFSHCMTIDVNMSSYFLFKFHHGKVFDISVEKKCVQSLSLSEFQS
jgi:hypothetical protein